MIRASAPPVIACFIVLLSHCAAWTWGDESVIIDAPAGKIEGSKVTEDGFTVTQFLGIPYAEPPLGQLRFARPVPIAKLQDTFKADKFSAVCPQQTSYVPLVDPDEPMSEDCLTLNIYVPKDTVATSAKAVMIFIHGGGYYAGSSTGVHGSVLANNGDIIVVTINYRLGALGFMNAGDSNAPGNMGLLDQHEAIQWVKRNIGSFGGDAGSLTIFGESAGGGSVSAQSLSPLNLGVFQRVIAQSGNVWCPWSFDYKPLHTFTAFVTNMNCTSESTQESVSCLQNLSWKQLLTYQTTDTTWRPTVDGHFLSENPMEIIKSIDEGRMTPSVAMYSSVDYMSGVNSQEGMMLSMFAAIVDSMMENKTIVEGISEVVYREAVKLTLSGMSHPEFIGQLARDMYDKPPRTDKARLLDLVEMGGDMFFAIGQEESMRLRTKLRCAKGSSYAYYLDEIPGAYMKFIRMGVPEWVVKGSNHADDLPYVFGQMFTSKKMFFDMEGEFTEGDKELSHLMMTLWSNFAKAGVPDSDLWEDYRVSERSLLLSHSKGSSMKGCEGRRQWLRQIYQWMASSNNLDIQDELSRQRGSTDPAPKDIPAKEEL